MEAEKRADLAENKTQKIFIDRNACVGCSVCTSECPEIFVVKQDPEHSGDFKSFVKDNLNQDLLIEKIEKAISSCPAQCISRNNI